MNELDATRAQVIAADMVEDGDATIRAEALRILGEGSPELAFQKIKQMLGSGGLLEKRAAFQVLAKMDDQDSADLLSTQLESITDADWPLRLDIYLAAEQRLPMVSQDVFDNAAEELGRHAQGLFHLAMQGGDVERGKTVFAKNELSCVRCHLIESTGGEVGPELTRIAVEKDREYLLKSIVEPNAEISEEFTSYLVVDMDGQVHVGIVKQRDDEKIVLLDDQGVRKTILQEDIDDIRATKSSMPEDLVDKLTLLELRDLIEYLASLK